jgi:hypothetical protein
MKQCCERSVCDAVSERARVHRRDLGVGPGALVSFYLLSKST